jgi:uncharacterized membrane protein
MLKAMLCMAAVACGMLAGIAFWAVLAWMTHPAAVVLTFAAGVLFTGCACAFGAGARMDA